MFSVCLAINLVIYLCLFGKNFQDLLRLLEPFPYFCKRGTLNSIENYILRMLCIMPTRLWIRTLQRMRSKRWYFVRGDCSQSRNRQYQAIPNNTGQFDEECLPFFWDGDTALFGDALMSTWQWQRLMKCSCTWVGSTYKVDLKQVFCARWRPADNIRCQICARQPRSVWPIYISTHTVIGNARGQHRSQI